MIPNSVGNALGGVPLDSPARKYPMYPHTIRLRGPWNYHLLDGGMEKSGTIAMPGLWHQKGLADYWGKVELRRTFNWVTKLQPHEVVWLWIDRCVGNVIVTFNGQELGTHDFPWGTFGFNVTGLLRVHNELVLGIDAPQIPKSEPNPYGTLGCGPGDWRGEQRQPVGGILGGVWLSIDSGWMLFRRLHVRTGWDAGRATVRLSGQFRTDSADRPKPGPMGKLTLRTGGTTIHQQSLEPMLDWQPLEITTRELSLEPWWPRVLGLPTLHDLTLTVEIDEDVCLEHSWKIGFRILERLTEARWKCNGKEFSTKAGEIWPDRSLAECFDEDPRKSFAEWSLAQWNVLRVAGHLAPEDFYCCCDREGLLIEQDVPDLRRPGSSEWSSELLEALDRLANHPCLAAWRLDGLPNLETNVKTDLIDAIRRLDPEVPLLLEQG